MLLLLFIIHDTMQLRWKSIPRIVLSMYAVRGADLADSR